MQRAARGSARHVKARTWELAAAGTLACGASEILAGDHASRLLQLDTPLTRAFPQAPSMTIPITIPRLGVRKLLHVRTVAIQLIRRHQLGSVDQLTLSVGARCEFDHGNHGKQTTRKAPERIPARGLKSTVSHWMILALPDLRKERNYRGRARRV